MSRGPADALTVGSWLRRSARLWGRAQRLLVFPLVAAALELVATLPAALAAGEAGDFTTYAGYAVTLDERLVDALGGTVEISAGEWAGLAAWLVASQIVFAWATTAFARSLMEGRVVRRPPVAVLARVAALYLGASVISLPIFVLAGSDAGVLPALALWSVFTAALLVADYAIAIDGVGLRQAVASNLATLRRTPLVALAGFWLVFATALLVDALFDRTIADADDVFPPFLAAAALAHGLRAYLVDCALIVLYLGDRETSVS